MRLTWLGHSGFRMEVGGQVLLIDPWLAGNPSFPEERRAEAITGATHVLLTHGHGDHAADAVAIARELGIPVVGMFDLMEWWAETEGIETLGFNKGGTVRLGEVAVTMVNAVHSSSLDMAKGPGGPPYAGSEAGYMIAHGGRTVYVSGDTDVMADMGWMQELHAPEIGILACGGHYTMDPARAAFAARRFFDFRTVVPCHWGTFEILAQDVSALAEGLPGVDVRVPGVLEAMDL